MPNTVNLGLPVYHMCLCIWHSGVTKLAKVNISLWRMVHCKKYFTLNFRNCVNLSCKFHFSEFVLFLDFSTLCIHIQQPKALGRVVYDRARKRKYYFEIPTFLQIEWGKSRAGNSKSNENKNKRVFVFIFIFIWCFEFSRCWFSSFNLKKGGNFKIIFPFPCPIIYNPGYYILLEIVSCCNSMDRKKQY